MQRLNHPVYRGRTLQIVADVALCALAYLLAFRLRFLDETHGLPHRYSVLFLQSVGFVAVGKVIIFGAFGLYQFDLSTWRGRGGKGNPIDASPAEQTMRAKMLYDDRGRQPWPICGKYL